MADSETRTYLIWNRDSVTTYIRSIAFTNDAAVSHHIAFPADFDSPYANQSDFTANTTEISQAVTYVSDVGDVIKQYVSHTGTTLTVNTTASLFVGYTLFGNGYAAGQTIASFSSATIITSAGPDGSPTVGENIQFSPPSYLLVVDNNSGVGTGWVASTNGYSGQTAVGFSSTNYIIMSAAPGSTPVVGNTINFVSPQPVLTLPAGTSSTFTARYTNNTTALGSYPATFLIQAQSTTSITKLVSNFVGIGTAPVDSSGGGGGGDTYAGAGFVGSITDSEGNVVTDSEGNAVSGGGGPAPADANSGNVAGGTDGGTGDAATAADFGGE